VALTPTMAQRELASQLGAAGLLLDLRDPAGSAAGLDEFLASPARRAEARATAGRLAETRFNWDVEQGVLVDAVRAALRPTNRAASA
jgi:hypothetical protein